MGRMANIGFINSFVGEVRKTQRDFETIRMKRAEQEQNKELFKLKKQEYELKIKKLIHDGEITPFDGKGLMDEFKDYTEEFHNIEMEKNDMALDGFQGETVKRGNALKSVARQIMPSLTIKRNAKGETSSEMTFKPSTGKKEIPDTVDKTLGALSSGGTLDEGKALKKFDSREDAEAYAAGNLGPDYKEKYPRAGEFIDKHFPPPDDFGYTLGQIKKSPKHGDLEYAGDNKWRKPVKK